MAIKKGSFIETDAQDLGKKLYSCGRTTDRTENEKRARNKRGGRKKPAWQSPAGIYMLLLAAFLVTWFLISLFGALKNGGGVILIAFIPSFFALFVCELIILLSVFGLWGKFARITGRSSEGLDPADERETDKIAARLKERSGIEIYEDYVVVNNDGEIQVIKRSGIDEVVFYKFGRYCSLTFHSFYYESVFARQHIPNKHLKKLAKIFGARLRVKDLSGDDETPRVKEKFEFDGTKVGGFVMGLIAAGAGGGVIAMHYLVSESIPIFLGAFFIGGGVLCCFSVFEGKELVSRFVIPFMFGAIFSIFPFFIVRTVIEGNGGTFIKDLREFLFSFNAPYCVMVVLSAIGVMLLVYSFISLIKYIREKL